MTNRGRALARSGRPRHVRLGHRVTRCDRRGFAGQWLTDWLEGRVGLAETSREAYEYSVQRAVDGVGMVRLKDLTTATLNGFYRALTAAGKSPATVQHTHAVINRALKDAVRQGVLARNPAEYAELPRPQPVETDTWTADELARFLHHVANHRLGVAWRLVCLTGMRRSEVLGVRWRNINLDTGQLAIVDTLVTVKGKPVFRTSETKTRGSRRVIALDTATVAAIKDHRRRQNEERLRAGEAWENLDLVFTNELGEPVNPPAFTRWTKQLAIEAGVTPLTPHDAARHGWATLALSAGVSPKVVSERLGHSSITMTMDTYSHVIEGMDRHAAETVAKLIGGGS